MSDEVPASVAQVSPANDHPHLIWMKAEIAEEFKRQGGGGGNMSDLERRVGSLETDVRSIRDNLNALVTDVAIIKSNHATKTDISNIKTDIADLKIDLKTDILNIKAEIANSAHTQTRWIIATIFTVITASIAIQRLLPPQNIPAQTQSSAQHSTPPPPLSTTP